MAATDFIDAVEVHNDTTANASPITTATYTVSAAKRTLLMFIDHERANSTTPLNITGITQLGPGSKAFTRVAKGDLGSAATVDVADVWILEDAEIGTYAFSVAHNDVTGSDIQISVAEYDDCTVGAVADPVYVPASSAAVARFDIDVPANGRLVYVQVVTASAGTFTGPSHGTSRLTETVGTGTGGGAMAIADYAPGAAESLTDVGYAFTPALGNWSNGSNHVVGFVLVPRTTPAPRRPAQVMML